jgi:FkbM family methyltransferase
MTDARAQGSPVRRLAKSLLLAMFRTAPGTSLRLIGLLVRRRPQQASILRGLLVRAQVEGLQGLLRRLDYPNELRLTRGTTFVEMAGLDLDAARVDRYFLLSGAEPVPSQGRVLHDRLAARGIAIATFVDLGANFGELSLWFARHTTASVLAVEPSTENIEVLKANARRNGIDLARITLVQKAVADRPGTVQITKGRTQGNSIVNLAGETETVASDSLDNILTAAGLTHVDCLKIDIEGAEPLLHADLARWVARIDSLVIEMGGGLAPPEDYDRLCRLFEEAGLRCELFASGRALTFAEVGRLIRTEHHDYLFYRGAQKAT